MRIHNFSLCLKVNCYDRRKDSGFYNLVIFAVPTRKRYSKNSPEIDKIP